MLDAFRKWMFGRVPTPKYGGVYVPTVLPAEPMNMAVQAAVSAAAAREAARQMTPFTPTLEANLRYVDLAAVAAKRKADEEQERQRRRRDDDSYSASTTSSSDYGTSLAIDTAISSAWSDSSSSWSSDSSSSGSDFSGGGGSFGGGGSDGSW